MNNPINAVQLDEKVRGTILKVVACVWNRQQSTLARPEAGESVTYYKLVDEATGEEGIVQLYQRWDKRSVEDEKYWTNNPKLFGKNHPEADFFFFGDLPQDDTVIGSVEPDCSVELEYREGPGWGLFVK